MFTSELNSKPFKFINCALFINVSTLSVEKYNNVPITINLMHLYNLPEYFVVSYHNIILDTE